METRTNLEKEIIEKGYKPSDIAKMLALMRLFGERKLTFHSELADRVNKFMKTDNGELIVEFLKANEYLWTFDVENSNEKKAYMLTEKGMGLLRRYL
ncbi:MAG: hypothetical protein QME12_00490 [Nanoarchaeota archaeon]|nr:hypothetical protein [Nanoarchaeota archaeon]